MARAAGHAGGAVGGGAGGGEICRARVGEEMSVNDVYNVFKGTVMEVANEVVGWRERKGRKKGNAWWTSEIKDAVEQKKRTYRKMLQRNLLEEVKARRKSEYKEWKKRVRRLIEESKRRVDEEFGRKLSSAILKGGEINPPSRVL